MPFDVRTHWSGCGGPSGLNFELPGGELDRSPEESAYALNLGPDLSTFIGRKLGLPLHVLLNPRVSDPIQAGFGFSHAPETRSKVEF
jgi:hypothetical protein